MVAGASVEPEGRAAVVIVSAGRPVLLGAAMRDVDSLVGVQPIKIVSVPDVASLPPAGGFESDWQIITGTRGASAQRNVALDRLSEVAYVFFFDDDSVIRSDYVANGLSFFKTRSDVVGLTGRVLLDGAVSGEISVELAQTALASSMTSPLSGGWAPGRELYGCNFGYRMAAAPSMRFDERLPLYSWLEDHDFARRLMLHGSLARVDDCVIVHRAASSGGRQAHERLGYSQVMNPVYLWRKGSFPIWLMAWEAGKRVIKNLAASVLGGERHWRRKRLRGNAVAFADVARRRITPERIVDL